MVDPIAGEHSTVNAQQDFGPWTQSEQRRVYLLCLRLLRDGDEAGSAAQDEFFKAYRAIGKAEFTAVDDASRWILRIAVRRKQRDIGITGASLTCRQRVSQGSN